MAVEWDPTSALARLTRAVNVGVYRGTEAVRSTAMAKIANPPKTGRVYKRGNVEHQASAPGEAPATDTGRLIGSGRTAYDRVQLSGRVTFSTIYAAALELGTQKMVARPFLRPSLAENRETIRDAVQEEVAAELSRPGNK